MNFIHSGSDKAPHLQHSKIHSLCLCPSRVIHVVPAIPACPVRPPRADIRPVPAFMSPRPSTTLADFSRHGIPKSLYSVTHGWSAFGGADHGWQDIGLERRARTLAQAVSGSVGSQSKATNVSALRVGADRSRRAQERSGDGEAACARRMRSIASLHCGRGLGRNARGNRTTCPSRQARRRQRCRAGDRRYCDSQERHAFGWCRCAICVGAGQDRELPDPGIADAGARRSAGRTGVAVVSSRELDGQAVSVGASGYSGRMSNGTNETGMALAEIDRVIAAGVRFGSVLADAGYGLSAPFRQGLTARKLTWAVGIPRHLKVYPADVRMIWPVARRGRPRQRHVPDILSVAAEDMLANAKWRTISWRTGTKGKLKARFAAVRVRVADGPPQRISDKGQQHLPGDEAWLIGEHRMSGEKKSYLANLPSKTDLRTLAGTIKARWICEQAHQQLKEELGLDHFEGRSWQGLHRHALMTMIAYAFLQYRRLKTARRKKKNQRAAASANFARRTPRHPRILRSTTAAAMPALSKMDLQRAAA